MALNSVVQLLLMAFLSQSEQQLPAGSQALCVSAPCPSGGVRCRKMTTAGQPRGQLSPLTPCHPAVLPAHKAAKELKLNQDLCFGA